MYKVIILISTSVHLDPNFRAEFTYVHKRPRCIIIIISVVHIIQRGRLCYMSFPLITFEGKLHEV